MMRFGLIAFCKTRLAGARVRVCFMALRVLYARNAFWILRAAVALLFELLFDPLLLRFELNIELSSEI
jgi:hypothetical protein